MSGPQGSEPNPWQAQPGQGQDQPASGSEQQPSGSETPAWQQPSGEPPAWQPPAYTPQQYPQYGQQPGQQYPQQPYQQPTEYNPGTYAQPGQQYPQYGQPQYGQYPQPGQYPQQPGQYPQQPGDPNQPGQYAPYPQPGDEGAKKSSAVIFTVIGVLAAIVVAVVLVLGFWKPGFFVTTKLDIGKAQQGVQNILTDETNGYGAKNVKDVKCNNGQNPTVKKGDTFTCEVSIDGTKRQVTVTFQDDKGTYEVGRPK
ncbi:DUF4333 domain-containing protein [Mycolicibacterium rhodesiae]|uniref:DUF4333 domain-containing protein n=1 Tax=Mycolicibacterium rhodesiae TaxID=36814 RepID=A0A1X0ISZ9_MYCRH|nr:DUF4333 domain-containing protein [Mycolicibacterium rhodesiae]MCV7344018.1 DUF4333 domain-containing protein [Mycolicibacterium rhodesiae]ORB51849.1 hypothetical protein BST42_16985 [Mycolicibacterium rhodesiae]